MSGAAISALSSAAAPLASGGVRGVSRHVLPGFDLTLGYTLRLPVPDRADPAVGGCSLKTGDPELAEQFWAAVTAPRVMASYRLTFGALAVAAADQPVFGLLVAWVLVRYRFPGKRIVDALVDLPFALPTAVAGIALTALLAGERLDRPVPGTAGHQGGLHARSASWSR